VAWNTKQLVKSHKGIFHEFQFGRPKSTCVSAILFKTISIDIINITKTPAVIHNIDATKSFDLVINGITLLTLRSLGFAESLTTMIGKLWSGRKCHVKTAYGVLENSYRSTLAEILYELGQGSTSATDLWGVLHGLIMHAEALVFIGVLILSVSGRLHHEIIGEEFINYTGLGTMNPRSK
jgi:hypothetical protein